MAGSIESPYSFDKLETLPDGTNVYGDWHDDMVNLINQYPYRVQVITTASTTPAPTANSPAMVTAHQSEQSLAMQTARPFQNTPQQTEIPTDVTIPSTAPSATQTVQTAPVQAPMTNSKTPKTRNNSISQPELEPSIKSTKSRDPPEDTQSIPDHNSTALLSYATASIASPPPVKGRKYTTAVSVASQSTILSPPPPTAPQQNDTQYASQQEVAAL